MKEALEAGADPNFTTGHYRYLSALMEATHWGNYEAVDLLLAQPGINVNHQCSWGWTALHYACERDWVAILKRLLQAPGILVNEKGHLGYTPIMAAAINGDWDAVEFLMDRKAELDNKDLKDQSIVHLAAQYDQHELIENLLDHKRTERDFMVNENDQS